MAALYQTGGASATCPDSEWEAVYGRPLREYHTTDCLLRPDSLALSWRAVITGAHSKVWPFTGANWPCTPVQACADHAVSLGRKQTPLRPHLVTGPSRPSVCDHRSLNVHQDRGRPGERTAPSRRRNQQSQGSAARQRELARQFTAGAPPRRRYGTSPAGEPPADGRYGPIDAPAGRKRSDRRPCGAKVYDVRASRYAREKYGIAPCRRGGRGSSLAAAGVATGDAVQTPGEKGRL